MKNFISLFFFLFLCVLSSVNAQNFNERIKMIAADINAGDRFGESVAISGDYAVVGAPSNSTDANGQNISQYAGAAYVFQKDASGNWIEIKKLVASDRSYLDQFGLSVDIDDNYIVVGAINNKFDSSGNYAIPNAGAVFVFKKHKGGFNNWGQIKKITALDRDTSDLLGISVAIHGHRIIAGARNVNIDNMDLVGAAYIFEKDKYGVDNWGQVKKIVASDRGAYDRYGQSVSIFGDYVAVGTLYNPSGFVYIYKKDAGGINQWGEIKKIIKPNGGGAFFGRSLNIDRDYIVIGATHEDLDDLGASPINDAGAAYIFNKNKNGTDNWGFVKKIVASDRAAIDYFGQSVAISGDYIVVGAPFDDNDSITNINNRAGAAYIFYKGEGGIDNWGEIQKIVASPRGAEDELGESVAISGGEIVIGGPQYDIGAGDGNEVRTGVAYFYGGTIPFLISDYRINTTSITVFPNPFQDYITINNGRGVATIYNILGQRVKQWIISENESQIETDYLTQGSYLLVIDKEDGTRESLKLLK